MKDYNVVYEKEVKIGYFQESEVSLKIEIHQYNKVKETVSHETVKQYNVLSIISSCEYFGGQHNDFSDCDIIVNRNKLKRIIEIWKLWHLNDMHAGCIHQTAFNCNVKYDEWKRLQAEQTARCPVHYQYGSKWLLNPLPVKIEDELKKLLNEIAI